MPNISFDTFLQNIREAITSLGENQITGQVLRELLLSSFSQVGFLIRTYTANDDLQDTRYNYREGEYVEHQGKFYISFKSGLLEPPSTTNSIAKGAALITERANQASTVEWIEVDSDTFRGVTCYDCG